MTSKQIPKGWGQDALSEFIETAQSNNLNTFVNLRPHYSRLLDIHLLYRDLIHNLNNSPDWFCGFFLLKAHACYLGAVRLAISAQAGETYIVLRGCLENSLYSLYFQRNSGSAKTWLNRNDSEQSKRRVKDEFTVGKMFRCLLSVDKDIHRVAKHLYDRTIDYGAHPNRDAILSLMSEQDDSESTHFQLRYLADGPPLMLALKTTAQASVCSLQIFRLIFKERFDILQFTDRLKQLESGL